MQGKITQVLNMKSTEILAMIEEASGILNSKIFERNKNVRRSKR